jgi:hypothetical protein
MERSIMSKPDLFNYWAERQSSAQKYNLDMSKWILASLFLLNGAPFTLVAKDGFNGLANAQSSQTIKAAAFLFATGLALAVICGFCAWLNTGMRELDSGLAIQALKDADDTCKPPLIKPAHRIEMIVASAFVAAVVTGFGSLGCFLFGAFRLTS